MSHQHQMVKTSWPSAKKKKHTFVALNLDIGQIHVPLATIMRDESLSTPSDANI